MNHGLQPIRPYESQRVPGPRRIKQPVNQSLTSPSPSLPLLRIFPSAKFSQARKLDSEPDQPWACDWLPQPLTGPPRPTRCPSGPGCVAFASLPGLAWLAHSDRPSKVEPGDAELIDIFRTKKFGQQLGFALPAKISSFSFVPDNKATSFLHPTLQNHSRVFR